MAETSLAELIAILQDNIQRSYQFIDDVTEEARERPEDKVTMTVSELSLTLPVISAVRDQTIDLKNFIEKDSTPSAFELSGLLLTVPMASPEVKIAVREQAYKNIVEQRKQSDAAAVNSENVVAERTARLEKGANSGRKAKGQADLSAERISLQASDQMIQAIRDQTKDGVLSAKDFVITVADQKAAESMGAGILGKLEITFKAALK